MGKTHSKNINVYLDRGQNTDNETNVYIGNCGYSDENMIKLNVEDKEGLELLRIKIVCEEFIDSREYEVYIDGTWFLRLGYVIDKDDEIEYNKDFMKQYELEESC